MSVLPLHMQNEALSHLASQHSTCTTRCLRKIWARGKLALSILASYSHVGSRFMRAIQSLHLHRKPEMLAYRAPSAERLQERRTIATHCYVMFRPDVNNATPRKPSLHLIPCLESAQKLMVGLSIQDAVSSKDANDALDAASTIAGRAGLYFG